MWRNERAGEDTCEAAASKSSSSSVIVTAARVGTCAMFERDREGSRDRKIGDGGGRNNTG
jgi:hypothetical protein